MSGLLVAGDPGCPTTPRILPRRKEVAREYTNSTYSKTAKVELRTGVLQSQPSPNWAIT
jgi:hypothetical protein